MLPSHVLSSPCATSRPALSRASSCIALRQMIACDLVIARYKQDLYKHPYAETYSKKWHFTAGDTGLMAYTSDACVELAGNTW